MFSRIHLRYQDWVLAMLGLFVVLLSSVFALAVFGKFQSMAQEDATDRFELISAQAAAGFDPLLAGSSRFLLSHSGAGAEFFIRNGRIDPQAVLPGFLSALEADPYVYGFYVGVANGEFLQAIGVRKDAKIVAALQAPANTYFAVRHIAWSGGQLMERWRFLSVDRNPLDEREAPATYSPTQRPWYLGAEPGKGLFLADPYLFTSTNKLGLTISAALPGKLGVIGADIRLDSVTEFLAALALPANSAIFLLDKAQRVVSFHGRGEAFSALSIAPLSPLSTLSAPAIAFLTQPLEGTNAKTMKAPLGGADHLSTRFNFSPLPGSRFEVGILAPMSEFTGRIEEAKKQLMWALLAVLAVLMPLALIGSRKVSESLVALAGSSQRVMRMDFSLRPTFRPSMVREISSLGQAQAVMHDSLQQSTEDLKLAQEKLSKIVQTGLAMSREQDRQALLRTILFGGRDIAHAAAGTLYLITENRSLKFGMLTNEGDLPAFEMPLYDADDKANDHFVSIHTAIHNKTVLIDDVYSETRFDLSGTKKFSEQSGFRTVSMLTVPLSPGGGEVIGVLQYLNALDPKSGAVIPFDPEIVGFVEALAAQSAVTLQNLQLLEAQKALMDSMIKIIAGAIDAKSPYTGGHCERVPELALMLADEATKVTEGALAEFRFKNEDEQREFRIGAWLHDCGKVTTPEYVVDKATKLETIYNRLHEVRTRFELLLRDADIARLKAMAAGQAESEANAAFEARRAQLLDDYAFIAETNVGGEFLAPERVERVKRIGEQTWMRHFDDRLGLSYDESQRYVDEPAVQLPVQERLLSDKLHHIVKRGAEQQLDPKHGFKLKVPEHLYNYGELYNLCVARGTLTEEERFKINEHIVQTIIMLDSMPFPKNMRRIPEYAGTHHETLIGTGYPRRLSAEQMSVPSRIMAIADIFEALTASDRPYKKPKTLSDSIKILSFFKKDKHIDAELFDLFLTSGVYLRYAERYLKPEQIDQVDVAKYLG